MLDKIIFWNVDTQKDFMDKNGSLYVPNAESIKPELDLLTDLAYDFEIKIVNTMDCHTSESKEFSNNPDFKTTFPPHCVEGSYGICLIPEVRLHRKTCVIRTETSLSRNEVKIRTAKDIAITKDQFDVFAGNPNTEKVLEILNPKIVVVYGVATNVCVDYAVKGLLNFGCQVIVIEDAIKEIPGCDLDSIYDGWEQHGVLFLNTDVLYDFLRLIYKLTTPPKEEKNDNQT